MIIDLNNPTSGTGRSFQWQHHNGKDENGEWVGTNLVPDFGGTWQYDMDKGVLCMVFSDQAAFFQSLGWQSNGMVEVLIETYHLHTPQSPWTGDMERVMLPYPAFCGPWGVVYAFFIRLCLDRTVGRWYNQLHDEPRVARPSSSS